MKNQIQELTNYRPLIVIIGITFISSFMIELGTPTFIWLQWMMLFMGLFFVLLSMFKLFDIRGFADGFQKYDVISKHNRMYAYCYPFLELILGLFYLSDRYFYFTNIATLILMIISAIGVIQSVTKGMNLKCACLGTALNVPLSTVSIVENLGMGAMAAVMLVLM